MTNPEIATGAYKDSDRAVRPGVRSRQVHIRKATGVVRPGSGRDRPQQGSRRVGTRKRQGVVKNATGRSDQAARSRRSAASRSDRDGAGCRDETSERGLSGRRIHRVCA
ncbi:hypothetical protein Taro_042396 [Colocasia esculenta]|uniref:Uncharacterized protein n=1 Tax=Colocasia esculenta TaxID=4460 RepID=A0A843WWC9_COLES|nr:hypothetical protein [Colocasia esculenta]